MALTANAQSALPPQPSWDETIVPALRKRLENESRVLTKRLSTHSIASTEESLSYYHNIGTVGSDQSHMSRMGEVSIGSQDEDNHQRPSAIPRPSMQSGRSTNDEQYDAIRDMSMPTVRQPSGRARTYSSPYSFQADNRAPSSYTFNETALPTPIASRSTSPMTYGSTNVRPTRIPIAAQPRINTGYPTSSMSSRSLGKNESVSSHPMYQVNADLLHDPGLVNGSGASGSSGPLDFPSRSRERNGSGILNEQAPFNANSLRSSFIEEDAHSRPSTDDERPFEHWYRGDVSRNGGVGELKVASRKEMLDIANYGHKIRSNNSRAAVDTSVFLSGGRKRSDSTGGHRESIYIDDAAAQVSNRVIDETPLTDIEADETDRETTPREPERSTPSRQRSQPTPPTPKPKIVHSQSEYVRGVSEPPRLSSTRTPTTSNPRGLPQSQSLSSAQQRGRTKSTTKPPNNLASSKKPKLAAGQQKRSKSTAETKPKTEASHYSQYPDFDDSMADAIPSWTQPKAKTGNWDDVVLPAVAKKMGLNDQYEVADGSPRPRQEDERIPPAPGTFGYDHSKYRPYNGDNDIPMDEFGRMPDQAQPPTSDTHTEDDTATTPQSPRPKLSIDTDAPSRRSSSRRRKRSPSPLPFSNYGKLPGVGEEPRGISNPRVSAYAEQTGEQVVVERREEKEEDSGGCCRCVIM